MVSTAKLKRFAFIFAVNILSITLIVYVADLYLHRIGYRPYVRTYPNLPRDERGVAWALADPFLGWTINPDYLPGQINPQGFRDNKSYVSLPIDSVRTRILILGDSFVVGASMTADKSLPGSLQTKLGNAYQVFNLAAPGWGIDQMYLAFERYEEAISPGVVILAFIDDDIKRVLEAYRPAERLSKPSYTVEDGRLVARQAPSRWQQGFNNLLGKSILFSLSAREIYLVTDAKAIVQQVFLNIAQKMKRRGGREVVVRIPTRDYDDPIVRFRRRVHNFESMLSGTGVVFLEAGKAITHIPNWRQEFYLPDEHMNDKGIDLLADYLLKSVLAKSQ